MTHPPIHQAWVRKASRNSQQRPHLSCPGRLNMTIIIVTSVVTFTSNMWVTDLSPPGHLKPLPATPAPAGSDEQGNSRLSQARLISQVGCD